MKPLFALCLGLLGLVLLAPPAQAAVPGTIGYQGRLYDASDKPIDATVSVVLSIYDAATGGTPVWTETQSVLCVNGYFAIELGSVTPFTGTTFDGTTRYLGVTVGTDQEMTPRASVTSVPYALAAGTAPPDARFGTNTGTAVAGTTSSSCVLGSVWLTAATVAAAGVVAAGQLLPISQNTAIFSLLGTTFGGDGRSTFALPDLRGAAPNGLTYVICTQGIFPGR